MQWPWTKILWSCINCMFAVLAELTCQCTDRYPETTQQIWWMLQILIYPFTLYKMNYFIAWWYFKHRYCLLSYTVNTTHQNDLRQKKMCVCIYIYIYIYIWTSNAHKRQWMCSMMILFPNFAIWIHWILYFSGVDFCITSTDFLEGIYKFIVDWLLLLPGHLGIVSSYEVSDTSICCYVGEKWVSSFNILDSIQYSF